MLWVLIRSRSAKALLMSTYNICFCSEIRKISFWLEKRLYLELPYLIYLTLLNNFTPYHSCPKTWTSSWLPVSDNCLMTGNQGPVVQSIVSLTSSLRIISLTVLADSIYNILIFFAEKMWVAAKATYIFSAKNFSIFAYHSMLSLTNH